MSSELRTWLGVAVLPLVMALPARVAAQHTEVPPPAAYALEGVTVVQADGSRREGVTLVIRGAFIEALGPGVAIPADAEVLPGDSLVVYPGLIDAQGGVSYEFPKIEVDRTKFRSWDPPRPAQGFMPHRRVVDHLQATGSTLQPQRREGIVATAVHPVTGLIPGRGAFLIHRPNAATPWESVHTPVLGPVLTLRGGMGYPGTLAGVLAFYRQTFADAARHQRIAREYARNPTGILPPPYGPDFEVLQALMAGDLLAYFAVNSAEDIRRVVALAEEFGLSPVVVGGAEAWKVAELLKARDIPVLLSLEFPKPQHWREGAAATRDTTQTASPDPTELKEKQRLEELYSNAARLERAGVRFALTSGGGKASLREGARKAIEYGLSESTALRALTVVPAELFGAAELVRIERGRPATFIVTDGPLFAEATRIIYTFVEGSLERGDTGQDSGNTGRGATAARRGGE